MELQGEQARRPDPPPADPVADRVARALRARGERMTRPRRAVLTALAATPAHLSVEQVAHRVAQLEPSVHLTSVYRTLEALARVGVVQHVHLGHGSTAYHLVEPGASHPHAQCRRCARVWDLPLDLLDAVSQRLTAEHQFTLDATHAALSGVCSECAADSARAGRSQPPR